MTVQQDVLSSLLFINEWRGANNLLQSFRDLEEHTNKKWRIIRENDVTEKLPHGVPYSSGRGLVPIATPEALFQSHWRTVLPTGARTLFVGRGGEVIHRGLNKFGDCADDSTGRMIAEELRRGVAGESGVLQPTWIQRKLAGFAVSVSAFEEEGEHRLRIASKHSLCSRHVELAWLLLRTHFGVEWRSRSQKLAARLQEENVYLIMEAIDRENDTGHPVREEKRFDGCLVVLGALRAGTVQELTLDWQFVIALAAEFGFPVTDATPSSWSAVEECIRQSYRWSWDDTTEGAVACFAVSQTVMEVAFPDLIFNIPDGTHICVRAKIKSFTYDCRRKLRELFSLVKQRGWQSLTQKWSPLNIFQKLVLTWAYAQEERGHSVLGMPICEALDVFYNTIGSEMRSSVMTHMGSFGRRAGGALRTATAVLTVGLPGAGKSLLLASLASLLSRAGLRVVYISRDAISAEVHADLSKALVARKFIEDKARRVTHLKITRLLKSAGALANDTVVLLDACHLSKGSRQGFARICASQRYRQMIILSMVPPNGDWGSALQTLTKRCRTRCPHPTLSSEHSEAVVASLRALLEPVSGEEVAAMQSKFIDGAVAMSVHFLSDPAVIATELLDVARLAAANKKLKSSEEWSKEFIELLACADPLKMEAARKNFLSDELVTVPVPGSDSEGISEAKLMASLGLPPIDALGVQYIAVFPSPNCSWDGGIHSVLKCCINAVMSASQGHGMEHGPRVEGNAKWLAAELQRAVLWKTDNKATRVGLSELVDVFAEKWNVNFSSPHCTLLYVDSHEKEGQCELFDELVSWEEEEVKVEVRGLLIDRHASCLDVTEKFAASSSGRILVLSGAGGEWPHITLGTRQGVHGSHCATMRGGVDDQITLFERCPRGDLAHSAYREFDDEHCVKVTGVGTVDPPSRKRQKRENKHASGAHCVRVVLPEPAVLIGVVKRVHKGCSEVLP